MFICFRSRSHSIQSLLPLLLGRGDLLDPNQRLQIHLSLFLALTTKEINDSLDLYLCLRVSVCVCIVSIRSIGCLFE